MIDVHTHLTDPCFSDIDEIVRKAKNVGVEYIITSITDPLEIKRAKEIISLYPNYIYLTIGFDPTLLSEEKFSQFEKLAKEENIIGIGEVGLDFYYIRDYSQRELQEKFFRRSIHLALERELPIVIHSRSAGRKALEILYSENAKKVIMHAFDGKSSDAKKAVERGFYFSIPTSVVYSQQKQKLVKNLPIEFLLLETDSPVLSPIRGLRNEPANLIYSLKKISEIKRIPEKEVDRITTENTKKIFIF
ncbi:MAG: TatD family hydrolase [Candidatus Methanomethylicia archaeon]|jgi:TatD DNase family protein|nr:TatD family hydrolase [Candidatus Methanomethylicia archaeon]MCQ5340744.1 TatD family hydrolase [Candidatus Methanomethylicia archaeon]